MSGVAQPTRSDARAVPSVLPRVAAAIFLSMALVLWVDVLFRARLAGAIGSSGYSSTAGLVVSAITLPVAVGLWFRRGWAWWAGLIAAAWLIPVLLVAFLTVLLLPATRRACLRQASEER